MSKIYLSLIDTAGITGAGIPADGSKCIAYDTNGSLYEMDDTGVLTKIFPAQNNTLEITHANLTTYYPAGATVGSNTSTSVLYIPTNVDVISVIPNVSIINSYGYYINVNRIAPLSGSFYNGKTIKITGGIFIHQGGSGDGRISNNYYTFKIYGFGVLSEAFQEFMYWNGVWYCDRY